MSRKTTAYDRTRKARAVEYPVNVKFAIGQQLTGVMYLSVAQLEMMHRNGDIVPESAVCMTCGEKVADCPNIGPYLLDWPVPAEAWRHEDGLVVFAG